MSNGKLPLYKEYLNEKREYTYNVNLVNESLVEILTILGAGSIGVFSLLQIFAAWKYISVRNNFKDADLRYTDLLSWWNPRDFIKTWKLVNRDKGILEIVNKLKDDPEIKEFLKNPKQKGWKEMLSKKLNNKESELIHNIYKKHFHEDGPKMTEESLGIRFNEGVMANLHIMAKDAKDFKDFEKMFYDEYGDKVKKSKGTSDWIKDLYNDTINETENLTGGVSDGMNADDLASKHNVSVDVINAALEKGQKIELEHTKDAQVAYEIAKDHIFEDPKYYDKLATIEEGKGEFSGSELIKFLKKLPKDISVSMPLAIRGGAMFDKTASQKVDPTQAVKLLSKYNPKKANGDIIATIFNLIPKSGEKIKNRDYEIESFVMDPKKVLSDIDKFEGLKISFDYSDFDKDSNASNVKKSSLD